MNIIDKIGNFAYQRLRRRFSTGPPMPISDGQRSSTPTFRGFVPSKTLQEVPLDFAREWFATMEHLAVYNPDVSYALDNIVQLANTDHDIVFADTVPDKLAKEMKKFLKEREKSWYHNSGGQRSLKSDLIAQVVINGCLSAEIIPQPDLSDIKQIARVSPKHISFVYNGETDGFDAYQRVNTISVSTDYMGMKKLNPVTYKYIAWRRIFEGPYPTPPFISAIEGLLIQKDMNANLSNVIQKLGMLGFLSAEVTPPEQGVTENEAEYYDRLVNYLETKVYPQLEKNLGKGMVAGFKDTHKFTLQGNNMNVSGAEGLVKIVQLMIFAGLKQDPNMLGRNYSTTETFGRVILRKMISQVRDYQQVVDAFYGEMYYLALRMAGYSPGFVEVKSQTPLVSDMLAEAQAETLKINNTIKKRNAGIIDQTIAAQELGYEEAAEEGPVYNDQGQEIVPTEELFPEDNESLDPAPDDGNPEETDPVTGKPPKKKKKPNPAEVTDEQSNMAIRNWEAHFKAHVPVYPYLCTHCEAEGSEPKYTQLDFGDPTMQTYADRYFAESYSVFVKGIRVITEKVIAILSTKDKSLEVDTVSAMVYLEILRGWDQAYHAKQLKVTESNVDRIYSHYRKDRKIFTKKADISADALLTLTYKDAPIPEALFDMNDFRAIEHAIRHDSMYLGKLITDPDTKKKIYKMLRERYIEGSIPFGNNPGWVADFKSQFSDLLQHESWKVRRIIDTSVSGLRNDANVKYMNQARVMKFEVIEAVDENTCEYCQTLNGMEFEVTQAVTKIIGKMNAGPENINSVSPFATTIKLDEFKSMSAQAISASGIQQPPYHPHCRGRIVAVI